MLRFLVALVLLSSGAVLTACGTQKVPTVADSRESAMPSGETVQSMRDQAAPMVGSEACILLVEAPYSGDSEPGKLLPQLESVYLALYAPDKCNGQKIQVRRTEKENEKQQWKVKAGEFPITEKALALGLSSSMESEKLSVSFTVDATKTSNDDLILAFEFSGSRELNSKQVRICGSGTCNRAAACSGVLVSGKKEGAQRFTCALKL